MQFVCQILIFSFHGDAKSTFQQYNMKEKKLQPYVMIFMEKAI
jgi:hypothetical protein